MAIADLPLLEALHRRSDWLAQRQVVVAENIANSDTPRYQPNDLKPQTFRDLIDRPGAVTMAATNPAHQVAHADEPGAEERPSRKVYETAPAGNAVILEEQLAKMNETAVDHRLVTQLYRKFLGMLRMAATARG